MQRLLPLAAALACGAATIASAETLTPRHPPQTRYELPGAAAGAPAGRPVEGRSIYRMEAPDPFWRGVDERGYPSGLQENPQTGG